MRFSIWNIKHDMRFFLYNCHIKQIIHLFCYSCQSWFWYILIWLFDLFRRFRLLRNKSSTHFLLAVTLTSTISKRFRFFDLFLLYWLKSLFSLIFEFIMKKRKFGLCNLFSFSNFNFISVFNFIKLLYLLLILIFFFLKSVCKIHQHFIYSFYSFIFWLCKDILFHRTYWFYRFYFSR